MRDAVDPGTPAAPRGAGERGPVAPRPRLGAGGWTLVVVVLTVGVAAQVLRPLAPELGPLGDPTRWFDSDVLARVDAYRTPLRWVAVAATVIEVAVPLLVAATRPGRRLVERLVSAVGDRRPAVAAASVVVAVLVATAVIRFPLSAWAFTHARSFGLSVQTPVGWFAEWAALRGVEIAVAALVTWGGYQLLRRRPDRWLVIAAPLGVVVTALLVASGPLVVEPIRFATTPLPEGALRQRLEPLLDAAGLPDGRVLVADASRRTTRQNAYVSGLAGTRRIVLYDTLLERRPDEVAAVLAHELAHDRHRDVLRGIAGGAAGWVVAALAVDAVLRRRVRVGRLAAMADPRGAVTALAVVVVLTTVSAPVVSWVSRRAEAAADAAAVRLVDDAGPLCEAQRGFVERNLSDPAPAAWVRLWWSSHPPAVSRLELGARLDPSAPACQPSPVRSRAKPSTIVSHDQQRSTHDRAAAPMAARAAS